MAKLQPYAVYYNNKRYMVAALDVAGAKRVTASMLGDTADECDDIIINAEAHVAGETLDAVSCVSSDTQFRDQQYLTRR